MAENENNTLSDKQIIPTDEVLFSIIGDKMDLWKILLNSVKDKYPDSLGGWNYYNDGKRWLFKMTRKKKTIFWAGVLEGTFRITFYFGDKAEPLIKESDLPQAIKDDFKTAKRYGSIRPVTIKVLDDSDVENVNKIVAIKQQLK